MLPGDRACVSRSLIRTYLVPWHLSSNRNTALVVLYWDTGTHTRYTLLQVSVVLVSVLILLLLLLLYRVLYQRIFDVVFTWCQCSWPAGLLYQAIPSSPCAGREQYADGDDRKNCYSEPYLSGIRQQSSKSQLQISFSGSWML